MCESGRDGEKGSVLPVLGLEEFDDGLELVLDDLRGLAGLALLEGLAYAEDDGQSVVERDTGLLGDELRGLVEEGAALGVTWSVAHACT